MSQGAHKNGLSTADQAPVDQGACNSGANQQWLLG